MNFKVLPIISMYIGGFALGMLLKDLGFSFGLCWAVAAPVAGALYFIFDWIDRL